MKRIWCYALVVLIQLLVLRFSATSAHVEGVHSHQCNHGHDDHHHHHHSHSDDVAVVAKSGEEKRKLLPEELAEEEDLKMYGFSAADGSHHHHHHHHEDKHQASELTGFGLWVHAMGCSLLVSLASLICLVLLPVIFVQGKPTKAIVDSLALFGAGAMLGDAFLHQLPHAFGGEHSHGHDDHSHDHGSHAHSLKDLSVGLSILAGIVLFLLVEKLVRYVDESSGGANASSHGHHHSHRHSIKKKNDNETKEDHQGTSDHDMNGSSVKTSAGGESLDKMSAEATGVKQSEPAVLRKRNTGSDCLEDKANVDASTTTNTVGSTKEEPTKSSSNLVFGYLNLFSDGVHNFTDGMALGSAFLLYGSIGGWSRTLFLLAHELPQEIGDFGILVRSGFSVSRALFFNFLSALVALAGTALALMWGQDPGQSSLIEGFTAGGFIYISVAGVLAEMNKESTSFKTTAIQLISLILGMAVALCISLAE